MLKSVLKSLQKNSGTAMVNWIQDVAKAVYRAANNPNYHMEANGELRAIEVIAKHFGGKGVFFDVGANVGQWSLAAARHLQGDGRVYAFEPSCCTYAALTGNTSGASNIHCVNAGLSDKSQSLDILFSGTNPEKSSVESYAAQSLHKKITDWKSETQIFHRGDEFCRVNSILEIAFMKIDAEGHDYKVLEGFGDMLREGVCAIQFEYNRLNIYTKTLLHDFYELLNPPAAPGAFEIGRVFPRSIRFKPYDPLDENFIDGKFIAVRRELGTLINQLRN